MQKKLLLERKGDQIRLAVIEDGELCELFVERAERDSLIGNIYVGRVDNVLSGMHSAFIDIGLDKNGFLSLDDVAIPDAGGVDRELLQGPHKRLRPGNELLVQVIRQPGGDKGPRLSCHITLPGRMLVLLPTLGHIGLSRKIEDPLERERLRTLARTLCPEGMGLIVRTAAENASESDLEGEIQELAGRWRALSDAARYQKAPALLSRNAGLVERAVRDMRARGAEALIVEGAELYNRARALAAELPGGPANELRLHESDVPLFTLYGVESQAQKALERRVWLKSGGYLVFDRAEALTVIDVNSGKCVGKDSLSETIIKINHEAAVEICRQLRLRDIGGMIVIDFIHMDEPEQREALLELMRRELKKESTKVNLLGFTRLGLVEMTRKKHGESALSQTKTARSKHEG